MCIRDSLALRPLPRHAIGGGARAPDRADAGTASRLRGKQAKLNERDLKIRQQINQNNIEKYKADFANEARQAFKTLEQAKLDIAETQKNIDLAKQIFATDKFRYEKGVLQLSLIQI